MRLRALSREFWDRFQFIHVYVLEAHPGRLASWGLRIEDPATDAHRRSVAQTCSLELQHGLLTASMTSTTEP